MKTVFFLLLFVATSVYAGTDCKEEAKNKFQAANIVARDQFKVDKEKCAGNEDCIKIARAKVDAVMDKNSNEYEIEKACGKTGQKIHNSEDRKVKK